MSAFQSKFDHGNLFISELKTVDFNSFLILSVFLFWNLGLGVSMMLHNVTKYHMLVTVT